MVLDRTQISGRRTRKHTEVPAELKRQRRTRNKDGDRGAARSSGRARRLSEGANHEAQLKAVLAVLKAAKRGELEARVALDAPRGTIGEIAQGVNDVVDQLRTAGGRSKELEERASELARTSRYKTNFLANMSHELRTPLNSLLILAKLLADNKGSALSPMQVEYARTILASGHELLALINGLLDLAKIEAGKVELQLQPVSLAYLHDYVEQTFRQVAHQKGVELSVRLGAGVPPALTTDLQRLQQILKNLLSNAFKFTCRGRVSLAVDLAPEGTAFKGDAPALGEGALAFAVSDTGIGIPEDRQQVIFEAFQQAAPSVSRAYGGTGLGLTISRDLARLLGGQITLTSAPGRGSIFTLYLPLHREGDEALVEEVAPRASREHEQREPCPVSSIELSGSKVLVIDDDPRNAFALVSLLENRGAKVLFAESARQALLVLASNRDVDLVLMDIMLPEVDGYEATQEIRKLTPHQRLPIIAVTARVMPGDREKCLDAGCSDFVPKPVDTTHLLSVIHRWLRRS